MAVDGMFVAIGLIPQNKMVSDLVMLDERGYIVSAEDGAVAALAVCDYVNML